MALQESDPMFGVRDPNAPDVTPTQSIAFQPQAQTQAVGQPRPTPGQSQPPPGPQQQPRTAAPTMAELTQAYQQYLGTTPTQADLAFWTQPGYASGTRDWRQELQNTPEAKAFAAKAGGGAPPTGGGGGAPGGGGLPNIFQTPFTAPPQLNLGGPPGISYIPPVPQFQAPSYTPPPAFQAPSRADVLADPSYQFRLGQGLGALNNTIAAQGLWGTGATGKALEDYAQSFASQEYSNVYNRNLQTYSTNLQTQYLQPYEIAFQNQMAQFQPLMTQYQTQAGAGAQQNLLNYQQAYQYWLDLFNQRMAQANLQFGVAKA